MAFMNVMVLLFILFSSPLAYARDDKGSATILSAGARICGKMTDDVKDGIEFETLYQGYIDGYLSAVNKFSLGKSDFFDGTDTISRYKFVLKYCQDNPLDMVADGIYKLILRYKKTLY